MAPNRSLLSVDEVAARWGVHVKTVYAAIQRREIRAIRIGRILRISVAELESIEQGRVVQEG